MYNVHTNEQVLVRRQVLDHILSQLIQLRSEFGHLKTLVPLHTIRRLQQLAKLLTPPASNIVCLFIKFLKPMPKPKLIYVELANHPGNLSP